MGRFKGRRSAPSLETVAGNGLINRRALLGKGFAVAGVGATATVTEVTDRRAAVALTETPFAFDAALCADLRAAGFDDQSILDLIYASSFFNWANRLMLTLGQPDVPKRFR